MEENELDNIEASAQTEAEIGQAPTVSKEQQKPKTKKQKFLQFVIFAAFSASAGIIQFVATSILFDWTHLLPYWAAFAIGLTLSVIWNFTFNRKFTFKASSNVPVAMVLVVIYNLIIVVPLSLGGDKLAELWGDPYGMLVTVIAMLINFITEFFWDKFIVFNDRVINAITKKFSKKKTEIAPSEDVSDDTEN